MNKQKINEKEIQEVLAFSNSGIIGFKLRFSKLIKAFEGIDWEMAQVKARELTSSGEAVEYIQTIREIAKGEQVKPVQELTPPQEPLEEKQVPIKALPQVKVIKLIPKKKELTIPVMNYQALMELAPELERSLIQKRKYWGAARKRGHKDVSLALFKKDKSGFYLELVAYANRIGEEEKMKMQFFVDLLLGAVEVISYTDQNGTTNVYKDGYKREMVKTKERTDQNRLLSTWLERFLGAEILFKSEKSPEAIQKKKQKQELQAVKKLTEAMQTVNDNIPDFELGEVQHLSIHKKFGITPEDIETLNSDQEAILYNTDTISDEEAEKLSELERLKRVEMKLMPDGKIYFDFPNEQGVIVEPEPVEIKQVIKEDRGSSGAVLGGFVLVLGAIGAAFGIKNLMK